MIIFLLLPESCFFSQLLEFLDGFGNRIGFNTTRVIFAVEELSTTSKKADEIALHIFVCQDTDLFLYRTERVKAISFVKLVQHYVLLGVFVNAVTSMKEEQSMIRVRFTHQHFTEVFEQLLDLLHSDIVILGVFIEDVLILVAEIVCSHERDNADCFFLIL